MNWTRYVVSGLVFVFIFALIGALVFSMPMPTVLVMALVAAVLWLIVGHFTGLFQRNSEAK